MSSDPKQHAAWLHEVLDLGVDEVFVHQVPREQDRFIDVFGDEVLPELVGATLMGLEFTSDQWWKNGVVYCLDVETFLDGDGDGVGDLAGLVERIDYLAGIGVSTLWLMPFYPTPDRDDGYDITDFYGVDPRLGTLGEFVEVVRTAHDRGMRVIIDLVVNHTSDRAPVVPVGSVGPRLALPRLVRVGRRAARGPGS